MINEYKTLISSAFAEYTVNKSKFISIAKTTETEDEARNILNNIKSDYPDATHHCYAYIIGQNKDISRYSDNNEPSGTAGLPILDVIQKNDLTNTIIIVTRYFGGILLGSGGLVRAYSHSASLVIEKNNIGIMKNSSEFILKTDYSINSKLDYILKTDKLNYVKILKKEYSDQVLTTVLVTKANSIKLQTEICDLLDGKVSISFNKEYFFLWNI